MASRSECASGLRGKCNWTPWPIMSALIASGRSKDSYRHRPVSCSHLRTPQRMSMNDSYFSAAGKVRIFSSSLKSSAAVNNPRGSAASALPKAASTHQNRPSTCSLTGGHSDQVHWTVGGLLSGETDIGHATEQIDVANEIMIKACTKLKNEKQTCDHGEVYDEVLCQKWMGRQGMTAKQKEMLYHQGRVTNRIRRWRRLL